MTGRGGVGVGVGRECFFALHFIPCPISGAYDLLKKQALAKGMQRLKEEWEPEVVLMSPNPSSDRMKLVR